jgi:transglutaminase/protease-like cytokinesis protein 3
MLNRESTFTLKCKNPKEIYNKLNNEELFLEVSDIDNPSTSDDYDYLYNNIDSYTITTVKNGVHVKLKWLEDKEQLEQVNQKIESIIEETGARNMTSDYEKAKILHDYIINITDYDYTCEKYTAFNAIFNQSTVCQGYSLLYYKLLTEVDVECRFITGYSDNEYHGWNLVKIGNYWYNVDVTWDDLENNSISHDYFLKGSSNFNKDHKRDTRFDTDAFHKLYPTAVNNY